MKRRKKSDDKRKPLLKMTYVEWKAYFQKLKVLSNRVEELEHQNNDLERAVEGRRTEIKTVGEYISGARDTINALERRVEEHQERIDTLSRCLDNQATELGLLRGAAAGGKVSQAFLDATQQDAQHGRAQRRRKAVHGPRTSMDDDGGNDDVSAWIEPALSDLHRLRDDIHELVFSARLTLKELRRAVDGWKP